MHDNTLLTEVTGTGPVRRLEIRLNLAAGIESVWHAISRSEELAIWWTGGRLEAREGGRIVLEDGHEVNGTVKLCYPPYLFAFSWNDAPESAGHPSLIDATTRSTVRFDLVESGPEQTALTFVQYLPPGEVVAAAAGWHEIVGERLRSYVETGSVRDDPGRFEALQQRYAAAGIS